MPEQDPKPLEFKIENGDVYFIEGTMPYYTHYGRLFTAVPTSIENQFEIKKFDVDTHEYKHSNELTSFEIHGQVVDVKDGFATALPPIVENLPEPTPITTTNELMEKLLAQEEDALNRDELLLEQQLLLLSIDLNTTK